MYINKHAFNALMDRIAYLEAAVKAKDGLLMQFHQAGLQSYEGLAMTEKARAEAMTAQARLIEAETHAREVRNTTQQREQSKAAGTFGNVGEQSFSGDNDI